MLIEKDCQCCQSGGTLTESHIYTISVHNQNQCESSGYSEQLSARLTNWYPAVTRDTTNTDIDWIFNLNETSISNRNPKNALTNRIRCAFGVNFFTGLQIIITWTIIWRPCSNTRLRSRSQRLVQRLVLDITFF